MLAFSDKVCKIINYQNLYIILSSTFKINLFIMELYVLGYCIIIKKSAEVRFTPAD